MEFPSIPEIVGNKSEKTKIQRNKRNWKKFKKNEKNIFLNKLSKKNTKIQIFPKMPKKENRSYKMSLFQKTNLIFFRAAKKLQKYFFWNQFSNCKQEKSLGQRSESAFYRL